MSKEGFIFLHRKIEEWEWYDDANTFRLFIHCLLEANFVDKQWRGINIKRGQFITSQSKLAHSLKLTVRKIRTALDKLKLTGELTVYTTADYSVITVNNYEEYQQNDSLNDSLMTGKRQANDRLMTTTNNDNNENNIYSDKKNKNFIKPTIEEIRSYCLERNNSIDANRFFDYYESKGWIVGKSKMKDWKASVRNWERNNTTKQEEKHIDYENATYNPYR